MWSGHSKIHIRILFSTVLKDYWELRAVVGTVEKFRLNFYEKTQFFIFENKVVMKNA